MAWVWIDPETKTVVTMTREEIAEMVGHPVDSAETRQVPFGPDRRGTCGLLCIQGVYR